MIDHVQIHELGDTAFLINFDQRISADINALVHKLDHVIHKMFGSLIEFTIPAYCSLAVGYKNELGNHTEVKAAIIHALQRILPDERIHVGRLFNIPVCFGDEFAIDRERTCRITGLDWHEVKTMMCAQEFRVYMIGFVAGFPYLGELPSRLRCPRHDVPRKIVARGSVAIAEQQCGIYPTTTPGGWNLIGRTPFPLVRSEQSAPFWLSPGDMVRFVEVTIDEFLDLESSAKNSSFKLSDWHG